VDKNALAGVFLYPFLRKEVVNLTSIENTPDALRIKDMYSSTNDPATKKQLHAQLQGLRAQNGYTADESGSNFTPLSQNTYNDSSNGGLGIDPKGFNTVQGSIGNLVGMAVNGINSSVNSLTGSGYEKPAGEDDETLKSQILDYIKEATEAKKAAALAGLDKAYKSSLSNLDAEQSAIKPTYYNKRNQAAAQSDLGALNFAQRAAARGLKGNAGMMPEVYRNASLQGQIGAFDQAEAAADTDIARRRTGLSNAYESDKAAASSGADAEGLQAYINQMNADRAYNLSVGEQTGTINGQDTLAKQQFDYSKDISNPSVYGQILANKQQELSNKSQEIQNSYLPQSLKLQAQRLEQQVKAGALDYDTALAQLNQIKAQTSNIYSSISNRNSGGNSSKYDTNRNFNADDYAKYIESVYYEPEQVGTNTYGNPVYSDRKVISVQGKKDIAAYLANLYSQGVDESIVNALAAKYNISL
jgi:hypothetical protein